MATQNHCTFITHHYANGKINSILRHTMAVLVLHDKYCLLVNVPELYKSLLASCFHPATLDLIANQDLTTLTNPSRKEMYVYHIACFYMELYGMWRILPSWERISEHEHKSVFLLGFQMVWNNVQQLVKHKMYRLLLPLLIFNGFEQGFVYADYTKVGIRLL